MAAPPSIFRSLRLLKLPQVGRSLSCLSHRQNVVWRTRYVQPKVNSALHSTSALKHKTRALSSWVQASEAFLSSSSDVAVEKNDQKEAGGSRAGKIRHVEGRSDKSAREANARHGSELVAKNSSVYTRIGALDRSRRGEFRERKNAGMEVRKTSQSKRVLFPKDKISGSHAFEWKERASSIPKIQGEVIYGVGPIYAALQVRRRQVFSLYVQENMPIEGKRKDKKVLEWILRSAIDLGIEVKEISKHDLNMLVDNRPHQGLVLDASQLELVEVKELDSPHGAPKCPVWVALDQVTDPQNFGAILRSSYFLGAAGVVVCAKNSAPLSAIVSKASAGALEVMEILSCRNMVKFLENSMQNGWRVVGAAAIGRGVVPIREVPRPVPTILVLGGEGSGLRTNVKRACDILVSIPGVALQMKQNKIETTLVGDKPVICDDPDDSWDEVQGDDDEEIEAAKDPNEYFVAVESLNVSVAAGILLHELLSAECSSPVLSA